MRNVWLILISALLISVSGCMTGTTIDHARGAWQGPYFMGSESVDKDGKPVQTQDPNSAYYCLLPLTIPADIVTSPIQLVLWLYAKYGTFQT
jgi:hypothetical protein